MDETALPLEMIGVTVALIVMTALVIAAFVVLVTRSRSTESERVLMGAALVEVSDRLRQFRQDEARFRAIVDALPDPVVQRDATGATIMNRSYARLLLAPAGTEAPAKTPLVVESGPVTMRPDGTRLVDEAIRTPDGVRWFAWSETTVTRPDGTRAVLRTGREITDRVAAGDAVEEARVKAEAANEAKSRFLATVSHEFRTPLSGILGMSDLLLDTGLDPEQTSYVQALRGSAEAFLSLIEEILDFSKIEAGRIDLVEEPFEIETLVEGVTELLAPRAQDKGIEIACHVASDVPRRVVGDRDRLRQVLFNLAGNAVKFTSAGGVGIEVARGPEGGIVFSVRDTGSGIAPDRLPHIFEEFEQGGLAAERAIGTGLGLAITRRIVDRMGGAIAVDSHLGQGSTFHVGLALKAAGPERSAPPALPPGYATLVVGATPFGAPQLARRIGEAGGRAVRVGTRREAEIQLAGSRFDAIVVDWSLGGEAVRAIAAAARAAGIARSIVLLSPFDRREVGSPHAIGLDAYLIKPIRTRSLFERLQPQTATPRIATRGKVARPMPKTRHGAPRVLLAEDNDVNALLAVRSLEKLGALVDWAKSGHEALARAEAALSGQHPAYDLILMDVRMPGLDGFEVTRCIREREATAGRGERCRIVALTASLVEGDPRLKEASGFDGFLTKPFAVDAIARELRYADGFALAS